MSAHIHIAIFRWKPTADIKAVEAALSDIENLATKVPGIIHISIGESRSAYSEGYTHVILVRGESAQAIESYRNHPEHKSAAAIIESYEDNGIGIDYIANEFESTA